MNLPEIPHAYIAVEGNIGSGKTTFTEMMGKHYPCNLILEQFADNPFLPYFYEKPEQFSFPLELFFMTERYKQMQSLGGQKDMFYDFHLGDYSFIKTLLFARNTLPEDEFRIFQKLWRVLDASLPKPDLIVYLHRPVEVLQQLISKRGRDYEQSIKSDYLEKIQQTYLEYFRHESQIPILFFDIQERDFEQNIAYFEEIVKVIAERHRPGLQHISIH